MYIDIKNKNKNPLKINSSRRCFFPQGKVFFSPLCPTNKAEVSLNEVRSDLSAGSGRWHPVIQLRFPLACAVCSPLSSADLAISATPTLSFASLALQKVPGQDVILGCGVHKKQNSTNVRGEQTMKACRLRAHWTFPKSV